MVGIQGPFSIAVALNQQEAGAKSLQVLQSTSSIIAFIVSLLVFQKKANESQIFKVMLDSLTLVGLLTPFTSICIFYKLLLNTKTVLSTTFK